MISTISKSNPTRHMFSYINASVRNNWNEPAFSDFQKDVHYSFGEVATRTARLGVLFDSLGVAPGSKIAICGTNCSNWAICFLSILMNDRVVVGMLPDFLGADIEKLVNHSDAELLLAGASIIKKIRPAEMPRLKAIVCIDDFSLAYAADEAAQAAFDGLDAAFAARYPNGYSAADVHYREDNLDELALINYTSGTTSSPKGVMLSYRSLSSNVQFSIDNMECHPGLTLVSMLPLAHMFGMLVELLFQFAGGSQVCFITRLTTPTLMQAFKEHHPLLIVAVPLVLEKIYQKQLKPVLSKPVIKVLWNIPGVVDKDGYIYLRGRCKTLILSPNGQNIYPEEIEALLNAEDPVEESLIVSREDKLVALIYPAEELRGKGAALQTALQTALANVNTRLPHYCKIASYEVQLEEFAKTPKKSIKRFMYK